MMLDWYHFSIIAAVFFGIQMILIKIIFNKGISSDILTTLFFSTTSIMLWIYMFSTQKVAIPNQSILSLILITSIITVIANLAAFKAISLVSNPGYHSALGSSLSMVIVFIISIFAFSLKPDLFGTLGIISIIIGVVLLSKVI